MNRLEQLEAEYRGADEELLHLVAFEVRRGAGAARFDVSRGDLAAAAAVAISEGWGRVVRWQAGDGSPGGVSPLEWWK